MAMLPNLAGTFPLAVSSEVTAVPANVTSQVYSGVLGIGSLPQAPPTSCVLASGSAYQAIPLAFLVFQPAARSRTITVSTCGVSFGFTDTILYVYQATGKLTPQFSRQPLLALLVTRLEL